MTFGESVLKFYRNLKIPENLPAGIQSLVPFSNPHTWECLEQFFGKYYSDNNPRILLMGINPGRFGAGVTAIGFTDPIRLESICGIPNQFDKKPELSSKFIYEVIESLGGPQQFYARFFISAVSPIGFTRDGKNYNYYDDRLLEKAIIPFSKDCIRAKISFGCASQIAFSIGQGKNIKFLDRINSDEKFFGQIQALPHPRWIMQYRLKRKEEFVMQYNEELKKYLV